MEDVSKRGVEAGEGVTIGSRGLLESKRGGGAGSKGG